MVYLGLSWLEGAAEHKLGKQQHIDKSKTINLAKNVILFTVC